MTTIESILSRLTKVVSGTDKELFNEQDMITERIEKYEKRMPYDKGKLNN